MKLLSLSALLFLSFIVSAQKLYPYRKGKLWGYSDESKKIIVQPVYNITYPHTDNLGLVIVYDSIQKKYSYGFLDAKGKEMIRPQFSSAGFFIKERSIVKLDNKFGVIDNKGKTIIPLEYARIAFLPKSNTFEVMDANKKTALFDLKGKKLIDFKYDDIDDASSQYHAILGTDATFKQYCTWVDRSTGSEIPVKLAGAEEFVDGLAPARDMASQKMGYMNTQGEWVIKPQYWQAKPFSDGIALIANSNQNTVYMFLNKKGDTLFDKRGFKSADEFKEGYAVIDFRYFIDKTGQPSFTQYNSVFAFRGGLAQVRTITNGRTSDIHLIDKTGKVISKTPYSLGEFSWMTTGGPIIRREIGKYGLIDRTGKELFAPKYDRLRLRNGYPYVYYEDKNYNEVIVGYVSEKGIELWDEK